MTLNLSHYFVDRVVNDTIRIIPAYQTLSQSGGASRTDGTEASKFEVLLVGITRCSDEDAHKLYDRIQQGYPSPRGLDKLYSEACVLYDALEELNEKPKLHAPSTLEGRLVIEGGLGQEEIFDLLSK